MPDLFATNATRLRAAYASSLACDLSAFASEQLEVVDRPDGAVWPYIAHAVTFGTGTVLSVDPAYRDFASALAPARHYRAVHPEVLEAIANEARRRGGSASATAPELVFTLARLPAPPNTPTGFELRTMGREWMNAEQASGRFENGVGEPGIAARDVRNQYALVLFENDEPVAVAGVFLTSGSHEIGVDVVRSKRGRGFGALVVAGAAREITARGDTPVYFCEATNIRSQRTALATGFLPVASQGAVS